MCERVLWRAGEWERARAAGEGGGDSSPEGEGDAHKGKKRRGMGVREGEADLPRVLQAASLTRSGERVLDASIGGGSGARLGVSFALEAAVLLRSRVRKHPPAA